MALPGALGRGALFCGVVSAVAAGWGWANGPSRLDLALMDAFTHAHVRPARADVVVVAIDDASLAALGKWPWRRGVHAALLDRLAEGRPKAIGLDVILAEPDAGAPDDDAALAGALVRAGRVVLPVHTAIGADGLPVAVRPAPPFAAAAAALGHINVELGPDGVARGVYLLEGRGAEAFPHWSLALLQVAGEAPTPLPGVTRPHTPHAAEAWWRNHATQIAFAGPPGHFRRVSYASVLDGRVPLDTFRGAYVLVGATAPGLGDAHVAPLAGEDERMPGVEIMANLLDALRQGLDLRRATPLESALFTLLPVWLALAALRFLQPRWALVSTLGIGVGVGGVAWAAQRWVGVQFAPLAAWGCLAAVHPTWTWLRMEAALAYLAAEVKALRRADPLLAALPTHGPQGGDALDRHMRAMATAVSQLRGLQRFVHDSLEHLADPVFVTDRAGHVLLANAAAVRDWAAPGRDIVGGSLHAMLSAHLFPVVGGAMPAWESDGGGEVGVRDTAGRDLLLKWVARLDDGAQGAGWIISLLDISATQAAQRQREEALRFISHDMRAPQSSILTLVELQRLEGGGATDAVLDRIARHAERTLALADDFVHLARAQSDSGNWAVVDLADVVVEAADRVWDRARARNIDLVAPVPPPGADVRGDRDALVRAVANLLDNAVRHGPPHSQVTCALRVADAQATIAVRDEGPGIAPSLQAALFEPYRRGAEVPDRVAGVGLGLAFVRAVATRHRGTVTAVSGAGAGCEFSMTLPRWDGLETPA